MLSSNKNKVKVVVQMIQISLKINVYKIEHSKVWNVTIQPVMNDVWNSTNIQQGFWPVKKLTVTMNGKKKRIQDILCWLSKLTCTNMRYCSTNLIEKNIFHYTTITDKSMSWFNSCIINLEKNSMPHFVK